jgi:hypothetical protein
VMQLPMVGEGKFEAALELLQTQREEVEGISGLVTAEDENVVDNTRTPATDQAVNEGVQSPALKRALEILVRNATEEFGFAPRDVHDGIFRLGSMREDHINALRSLDYAKLKAIALKFGAELNLHDVSDCVVAVYPDPKKSLRQVDYWTVGFKSAQIKKGATELLLMNNYEHVREMFDLFHELPPSFALAGWRFEAEVHHTLRVGWKSHEPPPKPIVMTSNNEDESPTFTTTDPPSTPDIPQTPLRSTPRSFTTIKFLPSLELTDVTLDNDKYYVPAKTTNPLFDSFTIDFDTEKGTAQISIFRITISQEQRGSHDDYLDIRRIVERAKTLLKLSKAHNQNVTVVYFLVCSDSAPENNWVMPPGWNKNWRTDDHRGEVFCLRIPVSTV